MPQSPDLNLAAQKVAKFKGPSLKAQLSDLESFFAGKRYESLPDCITAAGVDSEILSSAIALKAASSQISEVVHSIGILRSLPLVLDKDEVIESLSLGAGNTGRPFDLETNQRVAEFKFIEWKGADAVRQDSLFKDFYELAEYPTPKRKCLYVVGLDYPLRFLSGRRSCSSVLSRHQKTWLHMQKTYGAAHPTVSDYYRYRRGSVELVDLSGFLPERAAIDLTI